MSAISSSHLFTRTLNIDLLVHVPANNNKVGLFLFLPRSISLLPPLQQSESSRMSPNRPHDLVVVVASKPAHQKCAGKRENSLRFVLEDRADQPPNHSIDRAGSAA